MSKDNDLLAAVSFLRVLRMAYGVDPCRFVLKLDMGPPHVRLKHTTVKYLLNSAATYCN